MSEVQKIVKDFLNDRKKDRQEGIVDLCKRGIYLCEILSTCQVSERQAQNSILGLKGLFERILKTYLNPPFLKGGNN